MGTQVEYVKEEIHGSGRAFERECNVFGSGIRTCRMWNRLLPVFLKVQSLVPNTDSHLNSAAQCFARLPTLKPALIVS